MIKKKTFKKGGAKRISKRIPKDLAEKLPDGLKWVAGVLAPIVFKKILLRAAGTKIGAPLLVATAGVAIAVSLLNKKTDSKPTVIDVKAKRLTT